MSEEQVRESIIVAECNRTSTRATLVEMVEGACRYVAQGVGPSSVEAPYEDLGAGLRTALGALETATARRFTERSRLLMPQEDTGDGTDAFLATVASIPPLRIAIVASGSGALLDALVTIARRLPITVLPVLTFEPGTMTHMATRETISTLQGLHPDLVLVVALGDTTQTMPALLGVASEVIGPASHAENNLEPAVLVLAGELGREMATTAFARGYEFGFLPIDHTPPAALALTVETEILDLINHRSAMLLPGFDLIEQIGAAPPLARSRAIDLVNRFMALQFDCEVITVDFDEGVTCCWARGSEGRTFSEPTLDLGLGATNLLAALSPSDVTRWLPFELSEADLRGWLLNRALRPFTIPISQRDQQVEGALVREELRAVAKELNAGGKGQLAPDLIVGGSFFGRWGNPVDTFMALIDGLDPHPASGVVQVAIDREGLIPLIGVLGTLEPDRAAELFEHDGLIDLGACVIVSAPAGEQVRGEVEYQDGSKQEFTVTGGSLVRLPLRVGERAAALHIHPGGLAQVGRDAVGKGCSFTGEDAPHGGAVGLIIDARERPLSFPGDASKRITQLQRYAAALGLD